MTLKADPAIKQLWLDALESGEYTQTKGKLHTDAGYCCLGVLCDVAVKAGVLEEPDSIQLETESGEVTVYRYPDQESVLRSRATEILPIHVARWLFPGVHEHGVLPTNPGVVFGTYTRSDGRVQPKMYALSELNDTQGQDFKAIAAVIREQL